MRYLGGKSRIAKHIIPIMLEHRTPGQWFVEPFCGGCSVTALVSGNRIANDLHTPLIAMWQAVQQGWVPPQYVDQIFYNLIRKHPNRYPLPLQAFVGFGCSFGGDYFHSYAHYSKGKLEVRYSKNSVLKKAKKMNDVIFTNDNYLDMILPQNSIVYCDPPYANTLGYITKNFDHKKFWNRMRWVTRNHTVFISEYEAPDDFECIWEREIQVKWQKTNNRKIERLFTLKR